jgi:hypothetical protein
MRKLTVSLFLLSVSLGARVGFAEYAAYKPSTFAKDKSVVIVNWNSEEGQKRLFRSTFKNDFLQLAHVYEAQENPLYCGVASSVMVLNAMRLPKGNVPSQKAQEVNLPKVWGSKQLPFHMYTQDTFFNEETEKVKPRKVIELKNVTPETENDGKNFDPGFALAELKGVLESYKLNVEINHADAEVEKGTQNFREKLKSALKDQSHFVIVNFKGATYGAPTGGHISPLGAYDAESDSVLVLDVAGYLNPWHWVPVQELYSAMHTLDGKKHRGFLVVSENEKQVK